MRTLEACPLCGSPLGSGVVEHWSRYALRECGRCGLQIWDPPESGTAEWYAASDHYLTTPFGDRLGWNHGAALCELAGGTRTLLDIGCGDGRFVYAAAEAGIDSHGIDHSERLIRLGNERRGGDRLSRTSIEDFRSAGRAFDAVTLFEVIEHVPEPRKLLALAAGVARPGGHVVVSTPNRLGYPWGRHPMDRPPHHVTRWTPRTLRTALERAGLRDVRILLSPGEVGLRAYLMDSVRAGLVLRALRGRQSEADAGPAATAVRGAVLLKDRALRIIAWILAPIVGARYAGGAMVAIAHRGDHGS